MENKIDFSNLENFLDSAEAILMQKIQESDLDAETQFDLKILEVPTLRNQIKELMLKYVKNPESDQWVFELLNKKSNDKVLKMDKLCSDFNKIELFNSFLETTLSFLRSYFRSEFNKLLRDEIYYKDISKVRLDLQAFGKEIGVETVKLKASLIESIEIICANGEKIKGATYINQACRRLGFSKNAKDDQLNKVKTFRALLKTSGFKVKEYLPRDKDYYTNTENVLADLQAFAKKAKVEISSLNTGNIQLGKIICKNGESVKGQTYLKNATIAFGLCKKDEETHKHRKETIQLLLKTAGIEIEQFIPRDKSYYSCLGIVRKDLECFANKAEIKSSNLNTGNIQSIKIICKNGESINGETYLNNAARALGFSKNSKQDRQNRIRALGSLFKTAGIQTETYPLRDNKYYSNPKKIKHDLEFAAKSIFKSNYKPKTSILKLSTSNLSQIDITCQTGEKVKGFTYLKNAARALGFSKNIKEDSKKQKEALQALLKIAGHDVKQYPLRDMKYYSNPKNIEYDLEFAAKSIFKHNYKPKTSILKLNTSNFPKIEITCSTGEKLKGLTYLKNAARALGFSKNIKEDGGKQKETLQALFKIAGFTE